MANNRKKSAVLEKEVLTPKTRNNFTEYEKEILTAFAIEFKDIIDAKKNDGRSVSKKMEAWEKIASKFNAQAGVHVRTAGQLKKSWGNLKMKAKKDHAKVRREMFQTGGGPPKKITIEGVSAAIVEALADQINPLENPYDCDAVDTDNRGEISKMVDAENRGETSKMVEVENRGETSKMTDNTYVMEKSFLNESMTFSDKDNFLCSNVEQLGPLSSFPTVVEKNLSKNPKTQLLAIYTKEHQMNMKILQHKFEMQEELHLKQLQSLNRQVEMDEQKHALEMEILEIKKRSLLNFKH